MVMNARMSGAGMENSFEEEDPEGVTEPITGWFGLVVGFVGAASSAHAAAGLVRVAPGSICDQRVAGGGARLVGVGGVVGGSERVPPVQDVVGNLDIHRVDAGFDGAADLGGGVVAELRTRGAADRAWRP